MISRIRAYCVAITVLVMAGLPVSAGAISFEAAGPDAASIQATVDAFRAALGDPIMAMRRGRFPPVGVKSTGTVAA